jgi:hypothetical protein
LDEAKGFESDLLPPHILAKLQKEKEDDEDSSDLSSSEGETPEKKEVNDVTTEKEKEKPSQE